MNTCISVVKSFISVLKSITYLKFSNVCISLIHINKEVRNSTRTELAYVKQSSYNISLDRNWTNYYILFALTLYLAKYKLLHFILFFNCLYLFTDERDAVQKKTFTKWVNKHLKKVRPPLLVINNNDNSSWQLWQTRIWITVIYCNILGESLT